MLAKIKDKKAESVTPPGALSLRRIRDSDLDPIMAIEKASFTLPWTRGMFRDSLRNSEVGFHFGAWRDGRLRAYVIAWRVIDELHIGNIAVDPPARRMGIGEALMRSVLDRFWAGGGKIATLEVRVSNREARGLYRKLGFRDVAIRRGYYHDNNEDAVVMISDNPMAPAIAK